MTTVITIFLCLALGAVLLTLLFGVITMLQGKNAAKSNQLMRWRVGFQILAIFIFSVLLWWGHG